MPDNNPNIGPDQNPRQGAGAWDVFHKMKDRENRDASRGGSPAPTRASGRWSSSTPSQRSGISYGSPFMLMRRMAEDMDRIFDDYGMGTAYGTWPGQFRSTSDASSLASWAPPVEVFRQGDKVVVRADLPGMKKDDVKCEVENDVLTISGQRSEEKEEDREDYYRSERSYGAFSRSIPLPEGTDAEHCDASFKDGVLEVTLKAPEPPESKRKKIDIK
jgi:HSP20 family protein